MPDSTEASKNKLPVIMCVDVEPDPREIELRELPWSGYETVFRHFRDVVRPKIAAATGSPARFVWFWRVDAQIEIAYKDPAWALRHYAKDIEALEKQGDEIAVHPHTWAWSPGQKRWFVDCGNQLWVNRSVRLAWDTYREVFGRGPETIRVGDRWTNNDTVRFIEECGYKYDLTLEPGHPWWSKDKMLEPYTDDLPGYARVPRRPYIPSRDDYQVPDPARTEGLLEIPMSTGWYYYQFGRAERLYRKMFHPHYLEPRAATMNFCLLPRLFAKILNDLLADPAATHLALVIRTCIGGKPDEFRNMTENWETLLSHPRARDLVFTRTSEAVSMMNRVQPALV